MTLFYIIILLLISNEESYFTPVDCNKLTEKIKNIDSNITAEKYNKISGGYFYSTIPIDYLEWLDKSTGDF